MMPHRNFNTGSALLGAGGLALSMCLVSGAQDREPPSSDGHLRVRALELVDDADNIVARLECEEGRVLLALSPGGEDRIVLSANELSSFVALRRAPNRGNAAILSSIGDEGWFRLYQAGIPAVTMSTARHSPRGGGDVSVLGGRIDVWDSAGQVVGSLAADSGGDGLLALYDHGKSKVWASPALDEVQVWPDVDFPEDVQRLAIQQLE